MNRRATSLAFLFALTAPLGYAAPERGYFGLSVSIDAEGLFSPVLRSVAVKEVRPLSPAAQAGIVAGDQVIEVEGRAVAGAKAKELEPVMAKAVGESLRLKLKRPNGEAYDVTLIAAAKPK